MGFFATFSAWLDGMLATYIGNNTAKIAALLTPAIVALATVYVMIWGYLQLTGKIEEPVGTGIKRIILLVVILGGALNLWLYNDLIVDTFFRSPPKITTRRMMRRSEEHTSELQSRQYLVCRLLLDT